MKKSKNLFFKNLLLKILSLIVAIFIWLFVVNVDNPSQTRNFTSSVEVINENVLTDNGRYYTIPEGQNTVTFRVTAQRSVIERLSSADFRAVADMNNLEDDSRIPIEITPINHVSAVTISSQLKYLYVDVGEQMNGKLVITPQITGTPASGFVIDRTEVTPNVVTVHGPDRIVSTIKDVIAVCDVSGMSTDISENVIPIFLDGNGDRVDTTKLDLSVSEVTVNLFLTNYKEVPIVLEGLGADAEDSDTIDTVTFTPQKVTIRGDSSILNDITEIVIPSTVIDINNQTEDISTTVDIKRYLPEGVKLMDESLAEVKIELKVYVNKEKTFEIPTANIKVNNLNRSHRIEYVTDPAVTLQGLPGDLENVDTALIMGSIDVAGLEEGEHTVRFTPDVDVPYEVLPTTFRINIISDIVNEE